MPNLFTEFLESVELLLAAQATYGLDDELSMFELQAAIKKMDLHR